MSHDHDGNNRGHVVSFDSFRALCLKRTQMTRTKTTILKRTRARMEPRNSPTNTRMSLMKQLHGKALYDQDKL